MTTDPPPKEGDAPERFLRKWSWAQWIGLSLGLLALVFYGFTVLRMDYLRSNLLDLQPTPDATEYYAMARFMAHGEPAKIQIGREILPSRYPPGYSVLMLPWLKLLPENRQILAPFRTSQTMGLILLGSLWGFYWRRGFPLSAGIAVMILATLPGFAIFSRSSMSEISGIAFVGFAFMSTYQGLLKNQRGWIYMCALFLGLAVNVRTQLILFGPILLAMALIGEKQKWRPWLLHCLGVLIFFAICASPIFIINKVEFGHPFQTGYNYWVPGTMAPGMAFSGRHFLPSVQSLWSEFAQSSTEFTVSNIFGTGEHFTPAYLLLAAIGCAYLRGWRMILCAGLAWFCNLAGTLFYYYHDGRMFLPLTLLLVPLAALPVWRAFEAIARGKYLAAIPAVVLFLLALAGYPSQSGFPKKSWRSQGWDLITLAPHDKPRKASTYVAACELIDEAASRPGVVLSTINPVFLNAVLPKGFAAAPLDGKHPYCWSKSWKYGVPDAVQLARQEMAAGRPVYALFASGKEQAAEMLRLPQVPDCQWVPFRAANKKAAILQLQSIKLPE